MSIVSSNVDKLSFVFDQRTISPFVSDENQLVRRVWKNLKKVELVVDIYESD